MAATNFDEFVSAIAEEYPHAIALDWYRRLELTIRAYPRTSGLQFHDGPAAERIIAADPLLGSEIATAIAELRKGQKRARHGLQPFTAADATGLARQAFRLIGRVMRADDARTT